MRISCISFELREDIARVKMSDRNDEKLETREDYMSSNRSSVQ